MAPNGIFTNATQWTTQWTFNTNISFATGNSKLCCLYDGKGIPLEKMCPKCARKAVRKEIVGLLNGKPS